MSRTKEVDMAFTKFAVCVIVLGLSFVPVRSADKDSKKGSLSTVIYESGRQGYHTYRIPALVVTSKGTLLAFCEGRKTSRSDHGDIDLILRRSSDGGQTWDQQRIVYEEGGTKKITIGNPCAVVDKEIGVVWLAFCRDNDRVFIAHSADDGESWVKPREITEEVKETEWGWYATGPGHGIQLQRGKYKGRLVIPCDCGDSKGWGNWDQKGRSLVIYSDDNGQNWTHGGITEKSMNECEVVELTDGSLLLSMRNYRGPKLRAFALSKDGGSTWSSPRLHEQVYCPTCQASIHRYSWQPNIILHSGPGGPGRENLTIRLSYDEGQTWPAAKVLEKGSSAYSDLAVLPDGRVCCLFEDDGYKRIVFTIFSLQSLTDKGK
jgi:sialidase-1